MADTTTAPQAPASDKAALQSATPMMQQYLSIKQAHPDCLLFYRMGDFYELFFDDAVKAAETLDIALTKRGKQDSQDIPMCGVPHHSHEPYLEKLIRSGYKVAICEQMESPEEAKKRGYKAVVKREVIRIVTPGTITDEMLLDTRQSHFLCALAQVGRSLGLAWVDITTGTFFVSATSHAALHADLTRLSPKELLVSDALYMDAALAPVLKEWKAIVTAHAPSMFEPKRAERVVKDFYEVASLEAYGQFANVEVAAAGALLEYIRLTQKGIMPRLDAPKVFDTKDFMVIDGSTQKNLELLTSLSGSRKGSLLHVIDKTVTGAGARLLHSHLSAPLTNPEVINARLDNIEWMIDHEAVQSALRDVFKTIPDIERALSRICLKRGSPRDLAAIRNGLQGAMRIAEVLEFSNTNPLTPGLAALYGNLGNYDALLTTLQDALTPDVTASLPRDGGYIARGYHSKLDEMRAFKDNGNQLLMALGVKYQKLTGNEKLKIKQNNVLGVFIEVTPQHSSKMAEHEVFIHRQTLANAVRYSTTELKQLESDITHAKDRILGLEVELFHQLCREVEVSAGQLVLTAQAIASFDVTAALAKLATDNQYVRPKVDSSMAYRIEGGRHPVVEQLLNQTNVDTFIPNDCDLTDQQRLWLLTGPNMAGKSTFLRQNALIAIMAQMGSFVPAKQAHIGVVDRLFSRVGAADDLAQGRSTFMVEMVETATILNQSTARSLVILDEIGRGTATFDGVSIAWSVVEYLHHANQCRALFATHYHELTALAEMLPHLQCYTMRVKEWDGEVIFMHEVQKGTADRSYGIHVAKLAGLPKKVIARSKEVLHQLENAGTGNAVSQLAGAMPLFAFSQNEKIEDVPAISLVESMLKEKDLNELTPKQALDFLYHLKASVES